MLGEVYICIIIITVVLFSSLYTPITENDGIAPHIILDIENAMPTMHYKLVLPAISPCTAVGFLVSGALDCTVSP